jgi:hypothetical protein
VPVEHTPAQITVQDIVYIPRSRTHAVSAVAGIGVAVADGAMEDRAQQDPVGHRKPVFTMCGRPPLYLESTGECVLMGT